MHDVDERALLQRHTGSESFHWLRYGDARDYCIAFCL